MILRSLDRNISGIYVCFALLLLVYFIFVDLIVFFYLEIMTLARKTARREGIRTHLATVLKQVGEALEKESVSHSELLGLRNQMESVVDELIKIDSEISALLSTEEIANDFIACMKVLEPTHLLRAELGLKLEAMSSSTETVTAPSVTSQHCKLPKLELPIFKGDPLQWQGFWDQFSASIHLNENLSDIDRFNYLKRYLGGKALDAVSGLSLSSNNYNEAIDLLTKRFGDCQVLISAHMDSMLKLLKFIWMWRSV